MLVAIELENVSVMSLFILLSRQTLVDIVKVFIQDFNFMRIFICPVSVIDVVLSIVYLVDVVDSQINLSSINSFDEYKDLTSECFDGYELIRVDINLSLVAIFVNED